MKNKVLLIVEGEKTEINILGSNTFGLLSLVGAECEIVPFKNAIYELYDAYKKHEYDDLVSYLRTEKGLIIDDTILSKNAFSAIYLIFDYEPHHQKYSDKKIKEMLSFYNNETENGKLYINYPMVESYYHLTELPDDGYNERRVSLDGLNGRSYKKTVNLCSCIKKNKFTNIELCYIVMQNYNKSKLITKNFNDEINYIDILDCQIRQKEETNSIYVLNTLSLLPMDYNREKTIDKLKLKLKDNFLEINNEKTEEK